MSEAQLFDAEPIIDFQSALGDYTDAFSADDGGTDPSSFSQDIVDSIDSQSTILELGFNLVLDELRIITGNLDALSISFGEVAEGTTGGEEGQGDAAAGLGGLAKGFKSLIGGIGKQVKGILGPAALLGDVLNGVMEPLDLLLEPFTILGELIGVQLLPFIEPLSDVLFDLIDPILAVTGAVLDALLPVFLQMIPIVEALVPVVIALSDLFIALLPSLEPLLPILDPLVDLIIFLADGLTFLIDNLTLGIQFIDGIRDKIADGFEGVVDFFVALPDRIITTLRTGITSAIDDLEDFGRQIVEFINPFD